MEWFYTIRCKALIIEAPSGHLTKSPEVVEVSEQLTSLLVILKDQASRLLLFLFYLLLMDIIIGKICKPTNQVTMALGMFYWKYLLTTQGITVFTRV